MTDTAYAIARKAYDAAARDVIKLRDQKNEADETTGKIKAIALVTDEVQAGSNAPARDALLKEALENQEQYQNALSKSHELGMAIAFAEVDRDLAKHDMRYAIAVEMNA